ncbi:MAG TPA: transposase [Polyangiaceae bacterium]
MKGGMDQVSVAVSTTQFDDASFGMVEAQHGGIAHTGRRKSARPLEPTLPLYIVLRSSRAQGPWSLQRPDLEPRIHQTCHALAERYGVQIIEYANGGDQLHLLVRMDSRAGFQAFLRAFAGITARHVTGARKGKPTGKFWDALTYSRVMSYGIEFETLRSNLARNEFVPLPVSEPPPSRVRQAS